MSTNGIALSLSAYILWGLAPFFWKLAAHIPATFLLYHRYTTSFLVLVAWLALRKISIPWREIFKHKWLLTLSSSLICLNWFIFVWAVLNDRILETSLGYYLNPFVSMLLGVFLLKERLSTYQRFAVTIALIGVVFIAMSYASFPWISLVLAVSFAFYGFIHKQLGLNSTLSLFVETGLFTPIFFIATFFYTGWQEIYSEPLNLVLLVTGGLVTVVPLILYSMGVKLVPLNVTGMLQFSAPTISFFAAVLYFNEPFTDKHFVGFVCIWVAILIYLAPRIRQQLKKADRSLPL